MTTRSTMLFLAAMVACMHGAASSAATWTVDSPSDNPALQACTPAPADCSLHGALQRAAPSGDTIVVAVASSGPAMLFVNKSITLDGNNALLPRIEVANADPVVVLSVQIRNARWEGLARSLVIFPTHAVLLEDVVFRNNTTFGGSGGGAIHNWGYLTIRRALFENNEARGSPGGAILSTGSNQFNGHLVIEDSRFDGNYSDQGGSAIHHLRPSNRSFPLVIERSTFLRNGLADPSNPAGSARGFFGAIRTDGPAYVGDSYFADNDSRYASAIQSGGTLDVFHSTFYRNMTRDTVGEGGAMLLGGRTRLANVTVVGNGGTPTGGLYVYPSANVAVVNSLLADNTGSQPNISGIIWSWGNNLIRDTTGASVLGVTNTNLYNVDARWQVPAANGGPTFTVALAPESPAIDAGSTCILASDACGTMGMGAFNFDQRGPGFPRKRGNRPDIGAFESSFAIVRNTQDSGTDSLRQTIAEAVAGDVVRFSPAVFSQPRTINLLSTLVVSKAIGIEGPGVDLLTLDAGRGRRHLNVDAGGNLLLSGLRLTRGDPGGAVSGGAILNNGGTLEVRDAVFEDNAAQIGGCLYNVGTLTLTRVRMSNCRARAAAGALFNTGGANATIGDIRIEGSSAADNGGAIGNDGSMLAFRVSMSGNQARFGGAWSEYGTTTLRNSTISGNTATGAGGGGIHVDAGGRLTLVHGTVTLNTATTQGGGGAWNNGGVLEVQNSAIDGNAGAGGIADVRGVLRSLGHNLIGNTTGSSFAPDSPALVGNQLNVSARLSALADNGGFGPTHAPRHDSPVFDAGSAALGFDGRGLVRPVDFSNIANAAGGNGSDLGAYEVQVSTPTGVTAAPADGAVVVAFTAAANGGPQPDGFTATCGAQSATGAASPITVPGLVNGVAVTCTVTARAGAVSGVPSAPSASTTPLASLSFASGPPAAGQVRVAYAHTFQATGATTPTYTLDDGALPPGLALDAASGAVSGTPTTVGTFSGRIRVTAPAASPAVQIFAISIAANVPAPPAIGAAVAGDASVTVSFSPPVDDGGSAITLYNVSCTSLGGDGTSSPITVPGLPNGVAQTCQVTARNAIGPSAPSASSNTVVPQATTSMNLSSSVNPALPGQPVTYTATLTPAGASGTVAIDTGSGGTPCPAAPIAGGAATCTTTYSIVGTRTVTASYAGDAAHRAASAALAGGQQVVVAAIAIAGEPPEGIVGSAYGPLPLTASGGVAPYTFAVDSGALPAGLALAEAGSISGTPTSAGTYNFIVRATDAGGSTATRALAITVIDVPGAPRNVVATAGDAQASVAFDPPMSDGGAALTGYRAQCGTQQVDGTASPIVVAGLANGSTVSCTVRARNRAGIGAASTPSTAIVPQAATVLALSSSLNPALPGQPVTFSATATSSSATGVISFDTGPGSTVCAPAPLVAGVATCTTTYTGAGTRAVTASYAGDVAHRPATATLAGGQRIDAPNITISGAPTAGTFGTPYGPVLFAASGGVGLYTWEVAAGALPTGLNLGSDGSLAGTPTAAGIYTFTVRVTDTGQSSATAEYTVTIARASQAPLSATATPSSIRVGGTSTLATTGGSGTGAVSYTVTAGATSCAVAGASLTGLAAGSCTVTATRAADPNHEPATATVTVTVQPAGTDLEISKSNGRSSVLPESVVEYEILVANAGPLAVQGARVRDPVPTGLTDVLWSCTPVQGATCPAAAGTGPIDQLVNLPVAGVLRYVFSARVTAAIGTSITNTVSVETPTDLVDLEPADNTASDTDPVVPDAIHRDGFEATSPAISVPLRAP